MPGGIPQTVQSVVGVADLIGVFANAVLGGLIARGERFDPVGFASLAILSGLGGGLIRDTLLQAGPPAALVDYSYLITAIVAALFCYLIPVSRRLWDTIFPYIDALALGCWAAAGSQKALDNGLAWMPAMLLGMITAVGGGALRDIVLRRVPVVFGGNTLYATSALLASGVLVAVSTAGHVTLATVLAILSGAGLTLVAHWRGWRLPASHEWPMLVRRTLPKPRWRRTREKPDL